MVSKRLNYPIVRVLFTVLRSNRLFWVLFGIFIFSAVWIALSGAYSMAYDEYVHYGTIKLYTHQWSPFFAQQPPGADAFGAVFRDPSYLYHYLMSFPLRVFAHFVHAFAAQIIFLRLWDIAFFAGGILLFRRVFELAGCSVLLRNLALGFFLILPVVPFMAGQVNYDNLLFLLTALSVWLTVRIVQDISKNRRLELRPLLWLAAVALLASLVKYAYLPILVAIAGYLLFVIYRRIGWRPAQLRAAFAGSLGSLKNWSGVVAVVLCLLGVGLFAERYGVNLVRYHTPTPECNQVMSLEKCMAYGPFVRNYNYVQGHYGLPASKVAEYPFNNWMRGMMRSLFFVVANKENGYVAGEPLPLAFTAGWVVLVGGFVLVLTHLRSLWRRSAANQLFIVIVGTYGGVLFLQNFMDFLHTAVAVAIQGRYLVPILLLFLVLVAQAAFSVLRRFDVRIGLMILAVLVVMMFEGGGLGPFVLRAKDGWLWDAPVVHQMHHAAQDVLAPIIVGD